MAIKFYVNNSPHKAENGETILSALKRLGISIPTLCNTSELTPTGACRLCVVEDAENGDLITSCSTLVTPDLKIFTHSPEVIAARKTIVDLLLTNHPETCLYCDKSGNCELQKLAEELNIREKVFYGNKTSGKTDRSSPGIVRDMSKCILCGRCVRICEEILDISAIDLINRGKNTSIETVFQKGLYYSDCIHCGLCVTACPTGAILPKSNLNHLIEKLGDNQLSKSIVLSSATIADLALKFDIRKYDEARDYLVAALRDVGFEKVYTMSLFNDFFISEISTIVQQKMTKSPKTLIVTDCPAVKKYIQIKYPDLWTYVCKIPTPQQIASKLFNYNTKTDLLVNVSPCIADKYEAVQTHNTNKGVPEIDFVLTSAELNKLLKTLGVSLPYIRKESPSKPANSDSSAGVFFETKHGITEGIVRELSFRSGISIQLNRILEIKPEKDFIEYEFDINGVTYRSVAVYGVDTFKLYQEQLIKENYLFVEVRSCKNGCIEGCGQLNAGSVDLIKRLRRIVSEYDEKNNNNTSGKNPNIKGFYRSNNIDRIFNYD